MPHAGCVVWVCICDNISEPRKDVEDASTALFKIKDNR